MIHFFLAALGAAAVFFVLYPVFSRQGEFAAPASEAEVARRNLAEQKERILASLHDLDFEHSAGKLSDADYAQVRAEFLTEAAQVMDQLEHLAPGEKASATPPPPASPAAHAAAEQASATPSAPELRPFCIQCGQQNPSGASFCFRCGTRIEILPA